MTETTALDVTLDTDSTDWSGYTIIILFEPAGFTLPSGDITDIRITFYNPSSQGYDIAACTVSHAAGSGDAWDADTTPTTVTFDTGSATKYIGTSAPVASDWIPFVYNKTSNLLVAVYIIGSETVIYKGGRTYQRSYFAGVNTTATVDRGTHILMTGDLYCVSKIEFRSTEGIVAQVIFF